MGSLKNARNGKSKKIHGMECLKNARNGKFKNGTEWNVSKNGTEYNISKMARNIMFQKWHGV
jgi:hypothetical protein